MGSIFSTSMSATGATICLGLSGRQLKDKDFFSKSDPYVVISRPNMGGGFTNVLISETKKNTLNPDWDEFMFQQDKLNGNDKELNLKIEVYDDDGKKGPDPKDELIGTAFYSLKKLEAAAVLGTTLPITDGKKKKPSGQLLVRSYREI